MATAESGWKPTATLWKQSTLVDVKTIKPEPLDRWEQYQRALDEDWVPKNVRFLLQQEWQGGELWHSAFAARARFLEYSTELEEKLTTASFEDSEQRRILMLCGEGFHWRQDELEDFVSYYRSGKHRSDDPFSLAEDRYIQDAGIQLRRTISFFGCLARHQGSVAAHRINWHVQAPAWPAGFGHAA